MKYKRKLVRIQCLEGGKLPVATAAHTYIQLINKDVAIQLYM